MAALGWLISLMIFRKVNNQFKKTPKGLCFQENFCGFFDSDLDTEDDDYPEDVAQAMDELTFIIREQNRYEEMKEDIEKELDLCKHKAHELEDVWQNDSKI